MAIGTGRKLIKRGAIGAKVESTRGTPETLSAGDYFEARDILYEELPEFKDPDHDRQYLGPEKHVLVAYAAKVTFSAYLRGSGSAGTAPEIGSVLQACGLSETIVPSTSVTYAPESDPASQKSVTLEYFMDGIKQVMKGAGGNVRFAAVNRELLVAQFEIMGRVKADPTDASMPSTSYDGQLEKPARGLTVTQDGGAPVNGSLELDMRNVVVMPEDNTQDDGVSWTLITGREPGGRMEIAVEAMADLNPEVDIRGGSTKALALSTAADAGNTVALNVPYAQLLSASKAGKSGEARWSIEYLATQSSGDDEFSLVFT